jgi:DNA-binding CsgD family transcriptional regulator
MVGRGDQLKFLLDAVSETLGGRGQVVVIAGEAGIGKSRLVAEVRQEAERRGMTALTTQFFEQDASLPYAAFVDLVRSLLRSPIPVRTLSCLAPHAEELIKLVPELELAFPDLAPRHRLEPEQERRRLQRTVAQFVTGLADGGLVLVVEDVHWSDDASLEVLLQLSRLAPDAPVLLLVTCRSDESHPELDHLLASLERERLAAEIVLPRLGRSDVDAMVTAILASYPPPSEAAITKVYALTDGNPFFVEETVGSITEAVNRRPGDLWEADSLVGPQIPRTVRDVVLRRSAHLSAGASRTLALASVVGQRFDFGLLLAITGATETDLLADLKELVAAWLVIEVSADRFGFRHALTREAVYSGLLARERRALHAEIAVATELTSADALDAYRASLSYHCFEAGDWRRALDHALVAGTQAEAQESPRATIEHLDRAIVAAGHLGVPATSILRSRGKAHERLGHFEPARSDFESALASARAEPDDATQWQAMLDLGLLWAGRDYEQSGEWLRRALAAAQRLPDRAPEAHSLNRIGNWLVNARSPSDALEVHRRALAIFEASGDRGGIAETHDLMGMASFLAGDAVAALSQFDRAVDLFRSEGNIPGLISSLTSRGSVGGLGHLVTVPTSGRTTDAALADSEEALSLARRMEWFGGQAYARSSACMIRGGVGDFGRALAAGADALRIAEQIAHRQWLAAAHSNLGQIYVHLLAPAPALEHLVPGLEAARSGRSAWWASTITCNLALAHMLRSDIETAEAVLRAESTPDGPVGTLAQRRLIWAWGRLLLAQGDLRGAIGVARRLIASLSPGAPAVPALCLLEGEALLAAGSATEAVAALAVARDASVARGERPRLWEAHALLARAHRRSRNREAERVEAAAARSVIGELAGSIDAPALREGFVQSALARLPAVRTPSSSTPDPARFGGLTSRELAVVAQVAVGRSNREIARALFIVEKTVEAHISNSLGKLGFRSRSQLASWATSRDLVPAEREQPNG